MKRCPECRRDYYDDSLLYCLDDGTALLEGPATAPSNDEPRTAILHDTAAPSEAATRAQISMPLADNVGGIGPTIRRMGPRIIVSIVVVGVILVGGLLGIRYFRADAKQINSIAVMPFVNESGNSDLEYLTDGMTDTLISSLSQIPNLSVKAHTSVFRYKGKDTSPKTIATELGAQAILNGRVNQRGDQLTVNVELIDPQTENVLWSEKYDRKQTDVVALQSEIAKDVSSKLRSRLSGDDQAKIAKSYTVDPEANQLYLKGEFYWNKRGKDNLLRAAEYFKQAVEKDPSYALAYGGLAKTYTLYPDYSVDSPANSYPKSKAAAMKALELDDTIVEAHCALGRYYNYWEWDRGQAEKEYRRAIEIKPNYSTAHHWLGSDILTQLGRFDEAVAEAGRAQELDPLSPIIAVNYGDTLYYARRLDEAIASYRKTLELDPDFQPTNNGLGYALAVRGEYDESIRRLRKSVEVSGDPVSKGYLAWALGKSGDKKGAVELVDDMKKQSANGYVPSYALALAYTALGDKDNAFLWLNREIDDHGTGGATLGVDPQFDDLKNDPRFKEALKRVNLAQ
ncbi:MAG: tetratricopeptide repeat protein [Acidobacteria bacterium]|nr:tetratricopeptide repeat protein [Acidobacteriota bacterium]